MMASFSLQFQNQCSGFNNRNHFFHSPSAWFAPFSRADENYNRTDKSQTSSNLFSFNSLSTPYNGVTSVTAYRFSHAALLLLLSSAINTFFLICQHFAGCKIKIKPSYKLTVRRGGCCYPNDFRDGAFLTKKRTKVTKY